MLNSAEHEIFNAHKHKNIKKFSFFSGPDKPIMLFFLLIIVDMPTSVGLFNIYEQENISCSAELSMNFFYNLWGCIGVRCHARKGLT